MKAAMLAAAMLTTTGIASSQVMIETVAERRARCEATMPQALETLEAFVLQYEADSKTVEGTDNVARHIGKGKAPQRELRAIESACSVAAPAIGARAGAAAERLEAAIIASYDRF